MKYKVGDRIIIKESVLDFDKENKIPRIVTIEKIHDDIQCYSCKEINFVLNDNEIDKLDKISLVELSQMKNKPTIVYVKGTKYKWNGYHYFLIANNGNISENITCEFDFREFNEPLIKIVEEKKERWKPIYSCLYWRVIDSGSVCSSRWTNDNIDDFRYNTNNCFKTEEEAEFRKQQLIYETMVKDMSYEFSEEEWEDDGISKIYILFNFIYNTLEIDCDFRWKSAKYHFKTGEDAQKCLDTIGKDNYKKYILEVK